MNGVIGWGIIGCGDVMERKVGPSLQEIPGSRVVAVMRRSSDKVEEFARRYRVPFWTTHAMEVFQHPEVDALYVATPPEHHLKYALAACSAGKALLVEKPAGRSANELCHMIEAFRSNGLPLFVSYYRLHLPKFLAVREIIRSGRLGPVVTIDYQWSSPPRVDGWRLTPRSNGGGSFWDIGGHLFTLLDDWFGALELTGATAVNVLARHEAEDVVAIGFRTACGAVGTARWNSAAPRFMDRLRIEGIWGRLELECGDCASPLRLELDARRLDKANEYRLRRLSRKLIGRKRPKSVVEEFGFPLIPFVQRPMLEAVVEHIASGVGGTESAATALRASRLMDQALESYYGERDDAFWERPATWRSLRAQAARRFDDAAARQRHALTAEELRRFEERGYLGPFRSEAPQLDRIALPALNTDNTAHLEDPLVFAACTDPAVVHRVAQLFGREGALLFKSRVRVKPVGSKAPVPWHQDVGVGNGGYLPDGRPVPTITVWLALDDATRLNGAMRAVQGSHRRFYGDYRKNIRADLDSTGALAGIDFESAEYFEARAGEFYIFHSWLLHGSGPNFSSARRAILNMRFAAPGHDVESSFTYLLLQCGEPLGDAPYRRLAVQPPEHGMDDDAHLPVAASADLIKKQSKQRHSGLHGDAPLYAEDGGRAAAVGARAPGTPKVRYQPAASRSRLGVGISKGVKLAAIVPTYSDFPFSLRCVETLARHTSDYRALIIDDASPEWSDEIVQRIESIIPGAHIKHFSENDGLTRSWNEGLRWARSIGAEYAALINSDTLLPPRWFEGIEKALRRHDLVGPVSNAPGDRGAYDLQHVTTYLPDYKLTDDLSAIASTAERLRKHHGDVGTIRVNGPLMTLRNKFREIKRASRVNGFFMVARTVTWWDNAFDDEHVFDPSRKLLGAEDEFQRRFSGRIGITLSTFIFHYRSVSRGLDNVERRYSYGAFRPRSTTSS